FWAVITNGQGEMKGQIFRIAHLGFFDYMDTIALVGALEQVAHTLKLPGFVFGKALVAAQNVFASPAPDEASQRDRAAAGVSLSARQTRITLNRTLRGCAYSAAAAV